MTGTTYVRAAALSFFGLASIALILGIPVSARAHHIETALNNLRATTDLYVGERGDDVRTLQTYLIAEGLLMIKQPTGYYGPLTADAIARLQARYHLIEDGVFTAALRAAIAGGAPGDAAAKIKNAMSAAPRSISESATILDWPTATSSGFITLKQGSSEWFCLPDDPTTPGNDPLCGDANVMKFFMAWMNKQTPQLTQTGISYMLQGGSDQSNTDPFATAPEGGVYMHSPPHIMIFPTTPPDPNVFGTNPNLGKPWVMWANTPYAHIMIPVQ